MLCLILVVPQDQWHSTIAPTNYNHFGIRRFCKFNCGLNTFFLQDLVIKRRAKYPVGSCLTFSIYTLSFSLLLSLFKTEYIFK